MEKPNDNNNKNSLKQRLITVGLAGSLAVTGIAGLSGCEGSQPAAAAGIVEQPIELDSDTGADVAPPAAAPEVVIDGVGGFDDGQGGEGGTPVGHEAPDQTADYQNMKELADQKAQELQASGLASEIKQVDVFPSDLPNGYRVWFYDSNGNLQSEDHA